MITVLGSPSNNQTKACEAPESPADVDGTVSATAFLALDSVLAEGGPLLLAAEVAMLVDAGDATPASDSPWTNRGKGWMCDSVCHTFI